MQIKKVTFCNVQSILKGFDSGLLGKKKNLNSNKPFGTTITGLFGDTLERMGKFDKWKRKLKKKKRRFMLKTMTLDK